MKTINHSDQRDQFIYLDGEFVPHDRARVSVYDHGLLYGDGVYEGIRAYSGLVFQLTQHLDRLFRSARSLRLELPFAKHEAAQLVVELLRCNRLEDAYVRFIVTRGAGPIGPDPDRCGRPTVIVIAEALEPAHGDATSRGIRAAIVSIRRNAVDASTHEIKSLNYLNSIVARLQARAAGAEEAIVLDARGMVSESPICNVFIVSGDRLATPGSASAILHGITRACVIELAREEVKMTTQERDITPYELMHADEVFLTGTHAEIVGVASIDGIQIGDRNVGPVTARLQDAFRSLVVDSGYGVSAYNSSAPRGC